MHVVANRIGYEGPTASDSNSYKRMAAWCRKMELQYQLTQVLSPNKFLKPEQRVAQSQRIDKRKERLKETLVWAIGKSGSVAEVKVQMEKQGYKVELGRGIAFIDEQMVRFKGSQVGYSLADIEKTLKAQQLISQQQQQQQIREQKRQEELAKEQTEQHRYSGGISR
jgi:hypothetical protein